VSPRSATIWWGMFALIVTVLRIWHRVWLIGLIVAFWIPFSLKWNIRALARRTRPLGF